MDDPTETLKAMLGEEWRKAVGGHIQYGECTEGHFRILRVLKPNDGDSLSWPVDFLGWNVADVTVSGYNIGYNAIEL